MQAARDLVAAAAELSARVENGHDRLHGGLAGLLLDIDGNAPAVVGDGAPAVGVDDDLDPVAVAGHRLVDGVVDKFLDEVMETRLVGGADVHSGPAAHGLQPFEHLDVFGGVRRGNGLFSGHNQEAICLAATPQWEMGETASLPLHFSMRGPLRSRKVEPLQGTPATLSA